MVCAWNWCPKASVGGAEWGLSHLLMFVGHFHCGNRQIHSILMVKTIPEEVIRRTEAEEDCFTGELNGVYCFCCCDR